MPNNGKKTPLTHYNEGIEYFNRDDFKNAIKSFNDAIKPKPNHNQIDMGFALDEAYNMRGRSYFEAADDAKNPFANYIKAIDDYSEAIKINPDCYKYYFNRALARNEALDFIDDKKVEKTYVEEQIKDMEIAISKAESNEKGRPLEIAVRVRVNPPQHNTVTAFGFLRVGHLVARLVILDQPGCAGLVRDIDPGAVDQRIAEKQHVPCLGRAWHRHFERVFLPGQVMAALGDVR